MKMCLHGMTSVKSGPSNLTFGRKEKQIGHQIYQDRHFCEFILVFEVLSRYSRDKSSSLWFRHLIYDTIETLT